LKASLHFLLVMLLGFLTACQSTEPFLTAQDWTVYRDRFVLADGRVVDSGNQGVSHSEGQGYGLLLAQHAGDRESFARIWAWTRANLQVREDHLLRWRRRPDTPSEQEDPNNASDGDLLVAWALLRADASWHQPEYAQAAREILADVRGKLIRDWRGYRILLPGVAGFEHGSQTTINLSYWVFPALSDFARFDSESRVWQDLADSGRRLLGEARYGAWSLPPDWLSLDGGMQPAATHPPRFGYDAVRIPLYLSWAGNPGPLIKPFLRFWTAHMGFVPAWADLRDNTLEGLGATPGQRAIRALTLRSHGYPVERVDAIPEEDYYSSSLRLLSRLALEETAP
jgi:endoglucanase